MRTANPALNDKTFADFSTDLERDSDRANRMTLEGTAMRTGALLIILCICGGITWNKVEVPVEGGWGPGFQAVAPWMLGGMFGGLALAMILFFKKTWAPVLAPGYAACQGLFLGGISAMFEAAYPGIVPQAVALTVGVAFSLLIAYRTRMIRATENFKLGVAAATGGIFMIYMATMVLGFFGVGVPFIHDSGVFGIGFSLFVVIIAAMNLVLDFDFIETGVEQGAPKYFEWYAAFGLLVTLVWLYLEILRLLAKLRER
jgi:uncharacterized YccA/Bax inhibitor family protein